GPPPPPPPPPTQNYFVELAPAGAASYRGNGTLRTDTTDIVQGPDPSGYNGDGQGHWWFSLPSITGTITNMEFYAYANHTYYSNVGDGLLTPTILGNGGPNYGQPRAKWNAGRWPK
ncbi:hypothetical protein, partial [Salmonella enterica]|uniref:hypothetical protein n=1 Tax=Salmonella enterica TaxID=28901 RepID=UPI003296CAA9